MHIASVGCALPEHQYEQSVLIEAMCAQWAEQHHNTSRLQRIHTAVQVDTRHIALPIEAYPSLTFGQANDAFIKVGVEIGAEAITTALADAGLKATDVDVIFSTTVTGISTPSLDARLCNRLGFRPDIKRVPIFGLGCVAGAAGVARMSDYLRGHPNDVAVLLSVELCSLTLQRSDPSVANLIATGVFGDGASAVVAVGSQRQAHIAGPRVRATRSRIYPDTERVLGWDITDSGMKIVLGASLPKMVEDHIQADVDGFLKDLGLSRDQISSWVCHPGGPKVLEAMQSSLELEPDALELTWDSLNTVGNLSSSSVLFILKDTLTKRRPAPGSTGMMLAMGPGFCAEMVVLDW